ncbi:hypothetical protein HPB48_021513 [Haemaphysalis longicornis]|uniref:Peptidase M13 N-terminal domain-containing protein n=1 Tax=Haemaphysalis longicornis TaxID=44386 RepID=A0A9J6FW57_HAELO|nr:hypothetical protein HPB48_021513 [Haemaphysalis longicornis]
MIRAFMVKGASICFILGATMVIKFLAIAEQGMAFRHGHMSVRSNPSLSKLRAVCHSQACQQYSSELQSSLDVHVNPCHSLYGFVCGRWRRGGAVMSTRKAAEARLLRQALQSVMAVNVSEVESSASSTAQKVAALVHSCMYARRHPAELASFLRARRILPYRQRKPGDLLGILVDLSVNWDIHIWFQMRIILRSRNTPAVHIGRSQSLADWAAMVKGIRNTRKYNRGIEKVLGLLDLPREQQRETLSRVMALENLISAALGNSPVNEEPLVDSLETMAALLTPRSTPRHGWTPFASSTTQ